MVRAARMANDIVVWLERNGYDPSNFPAQLIKLAVKATRGYDTRTFDNVKKTLVDLGYLRLKGETMAAISTTEWPA